MPQTGLKKFLEYVQHGSVEKVARLLDKGLDPNYHDSDSGGECREGEGPARGGRAVLAQPPSGDGVPCSCLQRPR